MRQLLFDRSSRFTFRTTVWRYLEAPRGADEKAECWRAEYKVSLSFALLITSWIDLGLVYRMD